MDVPSSMRAELSRWNNGTGIDLEGWISCSGNYALATGYCTLFWPDFVEFEGYVLKAGVSDANVRQWEDGSRSRASVEWLLNHDHLAAIHMQRDDASKDKLLALGTVLREIYKAKLHWLFPEKTFVVDLYVPADEDDLMEYQLSFWQSCNENVPATPRA